MESDNFSVRSRLSSLIHAFRGLRSLIKNEHNARIHLAAAVVAVTAGILFKISRAEWMLIIIVIGMVFLAELLNSSLEALADIVDPEWNEKIRKSKDFASAAVLISAIVSVIIGGLIFLPKLLDLT